MSMTAVKVIDLGFCFNCLCKWCSLTFHKIPLLSSLLLHAIVRVGFLRGYTTASQSTTSITRNCLSAWVWKMGRVAAGCVGYALLGVAE